MKKVIFAILCCILSSCMVDVSSWLVNEDGGGSDVNEFFTVPVMISDTIEAIARIIIVSKVFQTVGATPAVEIDITGGFPVFIKRVMEIATHAPLPRNVVFEHIQTVICPF